MSIIYDLAYALAAFISSPIWIFKLVKTGKCKTDWPGRFGKTSFKAGKSGKQRIVFHAVSVGEVAAIRSLVTLLQNEHPQIELVVAATTNTGYQRAVSLYGKRHK